MRTRLKTMIPGLCVATLFALGCGGDSETGPVTAIKFCSLVERGGSPIELSIEVGTPPTRLTALSGACAPVLGQACPTVAFGLDVPVTVFEGNQPIAMGAIEVREGRATILSAVADSTNATGIGLRGVVIKPEFSCAETDLTNAAGAQ